MHKRYGFLLLVLLLAACGQTTPPTAQNGGEVPSVPAGSIQGIMGEYRDQAGRSYRQLERNLAFDWGTLMPLKEMPAGNFSAVWTGQLLAPQSGSYTFSLEGSGEATLSVAGQTVQFGKNATLKLSQDKAYALRLEYRKTTAKAALVLRWNLAGQETTEPKVVPASVFRSEPSVGDSNSAVQPQSEIKSQAVDLGVNLLRNGDFEAGSSLWVRYDGVKTDVAGRTSPGGVDASSFAWIQQDLPNTSIQAGLRYTLRVWGKASAGSCVVGVGFGGGAGDNRSLNFSGDWSQQSAEFVLPLSSNYIAVYLTSGSNTCTYDDAELIASDPNAGGGTPPAATPTNPIVNANFAFGLQGWSRFGGNSQVSNQTLIMAPYTWQQQNLSPANLQSGQSYAFSANLRSATAGQECKVGLVVNNGSSNEIATLSQTQTTAASVQAPAFTMPTGLVWAAVYIASNAANCEVQSISLRVSAPAGPTPPTNDFYQIVSKQSGLCLAVENGSTASEANVVQVACNGSSSQLWRAEAVAGGFYNFTAQHSGQRLDVFQGLTTDGTRLIQWPATAATNQQFSATSLGGEFFRLSARHSSKSLQTAGCSTATGSQIQQFPLQTGDCQAYQFVRPSVAANRAAQGQWSRVIGLSLVAVTAANLPDGRVMLWSGTDRTSFGAGTRRTYTSLFNPNSESATEVLVTETQHEMFCPGTAQLADGRIMIAGGGNSEVTSLYNPATNSWSRVQDMRKPRGYQANAALSNGNVFTLGGSWSGAVGGKDGEVWNPSTGWTLLTGALVQPALGNEPGGTYRTDNHMWLFATSSGGVFQAGPSANMNFYTTSGNGSVTGAGARGNDGYSQNGNAVMYDIGRILTLGGAPAYDNNSPAKNSAFVISLAGNSATAVRTGSLGAARVMHTSVALPDGTVLAVGGQGAAAPFSDALSVLTPELWNPQTGTWRNLANMSVPRNYHSVALLLPDGRVLSGGGGLCGGCSTNHPDVQIFSPPYLFNSDGTTATRPVITAAPATAGFGSSITVNTSSTVSQFVLMRFSSVTHTVNNDQRRVPLAFSGNAGNYSLQIPADSGIVPPGNYMLFALNAAGTPSMALTIRIGN